MKPLQYIVATLCILATSCNRHPDSPPLFENQHTFLTWIELKEWPEDGEVEEFTYYRSAITVRKIASDTKVSYRWSYSAK